MCTDDFVRSTSIRNLTEVLKMKSGENPWLLSYQGVFLVEVRFYEGRGFSYFRDDPIFAELDSYFSGPVPPLNLQRRPQKNHGARSAPRTIHQLREICGIMWNAREARRENLWEVF